MPLRLNLRTNRKLLYEKIYLVRKKPGRGIIYHGHSHLFIRPGR